MARLQHPNIVQIYEVGEVDGKPFFSLEFVNGGSLARHLAGNPQPFRLAAELVLTLAEAVQHAHQHEIIHRDLKPANVLLANDEGRMMNDEPSQQTSGSTVRHSSFIVHHPPKITDFGLAKRLGDDAGQTQTGAVMGTPSYMAPEQADGKARAAGPAVDVYALGAILYEILTGRPPFRGSSVLETLELVRTQDPVPPRRLQPNVPRDLETVCLKCLSKEPARRYGSAGALAEDLRRVLAGEPVHARPVTAWERALKWARRRPAAAALWAFISLAAIVLVVSGIWYNAELQEHALQLKNERDVATAQERLAKEQELWARQRSYASDMFLAYQNWNNKQIGRALARLQAQRPQSGQTDLRGFEWFCLWGMCHSDRGLLRGHEGPVNRVRYLPDGKTIISAGADKSIILWDAASGAPRHRLLGHGDSVWTLALSPDGRYLASGCSGRYTGAADKTFKIWDLQTRKQLASVEGEQSVRAVAFSHNGKLLAVSRDFVRTIELWDVATLKLKKRIAADDTWLGELAFCPDGRTLAEARYDGKVKVRDLAQDKEIATLADELANRAVHCVAFSPDGKKLASGPGSVEGTARIWDTATFKELAQFKAGETTSLAFSPDGQWLAAAGAGLQVFDLARGMHRTSIPGHSGQVNSVAFAPDGRSLVTGGVDGTVRLWDLPVLAAPSSTARTDVWCLGFSPDGKTLAVGGDRDIKLLEINSWKERATFSADAGFLSALACSPAGDWLASAGEKGYGLRLWDLGANKRATRKSFDGDLFAVTFSPDGKWVAVGGADKIVKVCEVPTGREVRSLAGQKWTIRSLAFSRDGKYLAVGCGDYWTNVPGTINLWDVNTGKEFAAWEAHSRPVKAVAFSPDGRLLASASVDETIKLWNTSTRALQATLEGHTHIVQTLAFSPDGKRLASAGNDKAVKLWDLASGQEVASLQGHRLPIGALAFSPEESLLVSASRQAAGQGQVRFWRAAPEAAESPSARRRQPLAHGLIPITFSGTRSLSFGVTGLDLMHGYQIKKVTLDSAGQRAGLKVGDVILKMAGKQVQGPSGLRKLMTDVSPGDEVLLDIRRGDQQMQIKVLFPED